MTAQPPADPCTSSFVRPSRASSVTHGIGWVRHSCRGVLPCGIVLLSRGTRHTALTATASRAMPDVAGVPLCRSRSDGLRPHSLIARRGARGVISSGRIMMSSFSSLTSLGCASDARPRPPCHAGCQREWRIWPPRRLCPAALSRRRPLMPGRRMAIMTKRGAARRGQPLKAIVLSLRNLLLIS